MQLYRHVPSICGQSRNEIQITCILNHFIGHATCINIRCFSYSYIIEKVRSFQEGKSFTGLFKVYEIIIFLYQFLYLIYTCSIVHLSIEHFNDFHQSSLLVLISTCVTDVLILF